MFVNKYAPKKTNEILGQNLAVRNLLDNIKNNIPTLLHGPTGTGKTSSIYAIANEFDYEILEINSSNFRNKEKIQTTVGNASQQQSLFNKQKIILVDELDGISGTKDRGGIPALIKILAETKIPIIMTSNDIWNRKFNTLRKKADLIEFKELDHLIIYELLKKVSEKEKVNFKETDLKSIARSSNGDLRAALTDLQIVIQDNALNLELLSERDLTQKLFNALKIIFKTLDSKIALRSIDNLDENPEELFLWLEENLPKEYKVEYLEKAFNNLSKADVFKGRIFRQQYYRFWVYQNALLTAGIALSKKEKNSGFINYTKPSRILKMYIAKMRNAKKTSIAKQIALNTHTSTKQVLKNFSYYKNFVKEKDIAEELELSDDEIKFLKS